MDPSFAKRALDQQTWRAIVLDDREINDCNRRRRLEVLDGVFPRVLNNALLHIMGAMACNHFEVALDLLEHPLFSTAGKPEGPPYPVGRPPSRSKATIVRIFSP